ncbi:UdgX family uracil-DNA binding protein [Prosthecomicrobium sp. N25]|uniref:UdgX family uracil-DNA binding protein n=1 Tax=Prosthecomicrobium sp. N25 TaxID=3129254 RepID=UPI00307831C5
MRRIELGHETDLDGFRAAARGLAADGVEPAAVRFAVGAGQDELFAALVRPPGPSAAGSAPPAGALRVPRAFLDLAERVACHRDPGRYDLLYRLLFRLRTLPKLLEVASDPDVALAARLAKAVDRDVHKMRAFVRFREVATADGPHFAAWFEPEHFIEERNAGFFQRRFAPMRWSILTPRRSIHWDTERLTFGPGARKSDVPAEDAEEALWLTYFASIFNPARLKVKAMSAEMPKRYWRNLPEAALIPDLIADAVDRERAMIAAAPTEPPVRHLRSQARAGTPEAACAGGGATMAEDLASVAAELPACRRCPLWRDATQAVPGRGPAAARLMFVGEQPGDREDLTGEPFVGPAGQVLDAALAEAGIDRSSVYVTNAVKHFKFEPRGKRRLHKNPTAGEIEACRWWLDKEIGIVGPKLLVGLGGSAVQAILQRPVKITQIRGRLVETAAGVPLLPTVHPSYILRIPDHMAQEAERRRFTEDLMRAAELAA